MFAQPVLNSRLIDAILGSNLAIGKTLVMDHAGQFVRCRPIDTTRGQSCAGWSSCDAVAPQPLQDKNITYAKLLADSCRSHALRLVHLAEFMLWGWWIFRFGSRWRGWLDADAVGVQPFAYGLRLNRVHLCDLRSWQSLNNVQIMQDFRGWARRGQSIAFGNILFVLFSIWRMVPSPREGAGTGTESSTVGRLAKKRCAAHRASHLDKHGLSVLSQEVNSKRIYLDYCGGFAL